MLMTRPGVADAAGSLFKSPVGQWGELCDPGLTTIFNLSTRPYQSLILPLISLLSC